MYCMLSVYVQYEFEGSVNDKPIVMLGGFSFTCDPGKTPKVTSMKISDGSTKTVSYVMIIKRLRILS